MRAVIVVSNRLVCLALFMVAGASCGWAQQAGSSLPGPLQEMHRAGESCNRSDQGKALSRVHARDTAAPQPEASCAAPLADVRAALGSGALTPVDVRPASDYQRFHALDALNLPARDLLHKPALKATPLLLVGSGKGERELYAGCGALRRAGFASVRVLMGGMISYVSAGLPLTGRPPLGYEMARLNAAELWEEAQFSENLVLVSEKSGAFMDHLPYAVNIASVAPETLRGLVEKQRRASRKPVLSVILAAHIGADAYGPLASAISPVPLLVYADSAATLKKHMAAQNAIWAAHSRGPKQPRCG